MKKRILVCDDNAEILEITRIILESNNYEVKTSLDCDDIFNKIEQAQPDLILMDLRIPMRGGANTTLLIKNSLKYQNIPVILFSANTDVKEKARFSGADAYLAKPFSLTELEDIVEKTIISAYTQELIN